MRRAISLGLAAFALVVIGALAAPEQAHAQVACNPAQAGTGSWPYPNGSTNYVFYCGGATSSDGNNLEGTLYGYITRQISGEGIDANKAGNLLANYSNGLGTGAKFWIFNTQGEFTNNDMGETIGGTPHTGDTVNITISNITGGPLNVMYQTTGADTTLAKIATDVAAAVNTAGMSLNVSARAYGDVVSITAPSGATFAQSVTGTGHTVTITPATSLGTGFCNVNYSSIFKLSSSQACNSGVTSGVAAVTKVTGSGTSLAAQWTALFETSFPAGASIQSVTAHEVGHWLNVTSAYKNLTQTTTSGYASNGTNFQSELTQDWSNFNNLTPPCGPPTSTFNGVLDTHALFFCNGNAGSGTALNPPYNGYTNNEEVLQGDSNGGGWSYFFNPNDSQQPFNPDSDEFFAQASEYVTGNTWPGMYSPDNFFINSRFSCTRTLIDDMMRYGQIPGRELVTFSGTIGAGTDTLTITLTGLMPNPQSVMSTVVANNAAQSATNLAAAIMANANLTSHGITATASGAAVSIKAPNGTSYSNSVTGGATVGLTPLAWPSGMNCPVL